jgi:hypothetical protein
METRLKSRSTPRRRERRTHSDRHFGHFTDSTSPTVEALTPPHDVGAPPGAGPSTHTREEETTSKVSLAPRRNGRSAQPATNGHTPPAAPQGRLRAVDGPRHPDTPVDADDVYTLQCKIHVLDLAIGGLIERPNLVEKRDLQALEWLMTDVPTARAVVWRLS